MSETELLIEETARSPRVHIDFQSGAIALSGESYPEDASQFYGPILKTMQERLTPDATAPITLDMKLVYFNSSSAKAIMNMFQILEDVAKKGRDVIVNWHYEADDDMMEEMGEDFAEDFDHATFNLKPQDS